MLNNQAYMMPLNRASQMVKKNPDVAMFFFSFILWIILSLLWLVQLGENFLFINRGYSQPFLPMLVFIALLNIVDVVFMFVNWRTLKRLEIKRLQAAAGDQRYIFASQPQIAEKDLNQAFPMIIEHRYDWRKFAAVVGIIILLVAILLGIVVIVSPSFFSDWIFVGIVLVGFIVFTTIIVVIMFAIMYSKFKYKIILTEEGLFIEGNFQLKWIAWRDARLFAIDAVPWTKKHTDPVQYELSSANEILKWQWARPVRRWLPIVNLSKPVIAQEEYNMQMQNALAIMRQRTGLPLQDLRDHAQK